MSKTSLNIKKRLVIFLVLCMLGLTIPMGNIAYLEMKKGSEFTEKAGEQQTRERVITASRGKILDRNGVGLALTETVYTVSTIYSQIQDFEEAAKVLSEKLELDYDKLYEKIKKRVALTRIKNKVDEETAEQIRQMNIAGIVVDEDVKRIYPYSTLAAQVIGFVGNDNQGIIGLEAKYDSYLKGKDGRIETVTDVRGRNIEGAQTSRVEPIEGNSLMTTIDVTVQQYAEQTLAKALELKQAKRGAIIVINPQNGEIYAMTNQPDFDLNQPFTINDEELLSDWDNLDSKTRNEALNKMWRNFSINDSYEPGSTFKIVTSTIGLELGIVRPSDHFNCTGVHTVGGVNIKCWRYPRAHGGETFVQGVQNSCNPVFMQVAEKIGAEKFYEYMQKFGLMKKTGIDLPGETSGIMHKLENIGPVELATISFGQSFQITPLQLLKAASIAVNGGYEITPHVGMEIVDIDGNSIKEISAEKGEQIISTQTSEEMKEILESVVSVGTGNKTYIAGYRIGGKTATSEKLPRRSGKYIASFLAFAPAENPQVMALVIIDEPQGVYYGGTVAGPVMKELMDNILPYLGIEAVYTDEELKHLEVAEVEVPELTGKTVEEAKKILQELELEIDVKGEGESIVLQFPKQGEKVNTKNTITVYLK